MEIFILKYLAILCFSTCINFSVTSTISPDSKRLYHDIASGRGLYHGFGEITELGGENFKNIVFKEEKHKLWVVEFYNSWCGHCHRFAPTWKALAVDIYEWRDIIKIGAVDCAIDANNQLCRELEVMSYPMIKIFPPHSAESFLGEDFEKDEDIDRMRDRIVARYLNHQNTLTKVDQGVNLKPLTLPSVDATLWNEIAPEVKYLVLVFEAEGSVVGPTVALDISRGSQEALTRIVDPSNEQLALTLGVDQGSNSVIVLGRDSTHTNLEITNFNRREVNKAVRKFLRDHGINIAAELPENPKVITSDVDLSDVMHIMQLEDDIKKQLNTVSLATIVFQLDLEGALRYSLRNEVSLSQNISGEKLDALKNYLAVLIKYFPFGKQGLNFLTELKKITDDKMNISGKEVRKAFTKLEEEFKPFLPHEGWMGCRGSSEMYRGYPCSLWTLFHTLTVHEEINDRDKMDEKPEVLAAMAGYIKNFFSCSECSQHFTGMAENISKEVHNQHDMVMWLWKAHNQVNKRLAGDDSEDPKHPKTQFPNAEACPSCHLEGDKWDESEVFNFLSHMYSNVVYLQPEDLSSATKAPSSDASTTQYAKSLRNEMYGDEKGFIQQQTSGDARRTLWGFNIFDISLCVLLYICSVAILILVCIKFVFKRSYRKKHYIHDILSKV